MKIKRKKKYDKTRLEQLLKNIYFTEETWKERTEYNKNDYLTLLHKKLTSLMKLSLNSMMSIASNNDVQTGINSLSEWLKDESFKEEDLTRFENQLSHLSNIYLNMHSCVNLRKRSLGDKEGEWTYLTYAPPPQFKGITDMVFLKLSINDYEQINQLLKDKFKIEDKNYYV